MAKINDIHNVIVSAANINLSAHTYTEIYGGSAGCTCMVNGQTGVAIGASSSLSISVRTFSGGTGCFLLGENINVGLGSLIIG